MLLAQQLQFGHAARPLLQNPFSGNFQKARFIGIIGRNGSGKSTFLRQLARFQQPISGSLFLDGQAYSSYSPLAFARKLAWVGTEKPLFSYLSVEELVSLGRHPHLGFGGVLSPDDRKIVQAALEKTGINFLSHKLIAQCSDGEKQSAMLARAFAQATPVLLLDEVTAHLDFVHRHRTFTLLRELAEKEEKLILLATHEIDLAMKYCHEILLLHEGQIQHLSTEQLAQSNLLQHIFEGFVMF